MESGLFLLVQAPVEIISAAIAMWFFYVQHQFEDTLWLHDGDWRFHEAALHDSSHSELPPAIAWFTGTIGVHPVNHLSSRIPFYRLPQVFRDHPQLASVGRLTFLQSLRCARLARWDERRKRLISFREQSRLRRGAALGLFTWRAGVLRSVLQTPAVFERAARGHDARAKPPPHNSSNRL